MTPLRFDVTMARKIDEQYAKPGVVAQRRCILDLLALQPDENVLDIGSGTGYLLADMAQVVGPGGSVHGVDSSVSMNSIAAERNAGSPWVHVDVGDATALPYGDGAFDAAVSAQVFEYLDDVPRALDELRRVLRPTGRALILDTDWDSLVWNVDDRELHRRVVSAWEEHVAHPRLPRVLGRLARAAGFTVLGHYVHTLLDTEDDQDAFSPAMANSIASFVLGRRGIGAVDVSSWLADIRGSADAGEYFFSVNRYIVAVAR
jgi:ubiquinone/menaquinone biosynthesis C-methylase UbiE